MSTKLEPCPFDASKKLTVDHFDDDYHVRCEECGATGPSRRTWAEAVKAWNTRAPRNDGDGKK